MDLSSGYPYWLLKDGLPFEYNKMDGDLRTDVFILGGGISGALVAWWLADAGISCVIADRRSIGMGSTCASTGLLQYEIDTPLVKLQHRIGLPDAVLAYKLCEESIFQLRDLATIIGYKGFNERRSLYFAAHSKHLRFVRDEFRIRQEHGFDVAFLGEKEIVNAFGFNSPAAILSASGAEMNTYGFTHALLQDAINKGLLVYDRTWITDIRHNRKHVQLKTADGFTVRARHLVYATGYESVNYIDKKIVDLRSTYAVISEHANPDAFLWNEDVMLWNTADPYIYMRSTTDRRVVVGGRDEDFSNPARRDKLIGRKGRQLAGDFRKLFPDIPFHPEFSWTGTFGSTADGLPFIGPYPGLPNSFFALGFGGNGITFSQIAAVLARDYITGVKNPHLDLFSFNRI